MIRMALGTTVVVGTLISTISAGAQTELGFDCMSYVSQEAAQSALERNQTDPFGLDQDGDGIACEGVAYESAAPSLPTIFGQGDPADIAGYEVASEEFQDVQRDRVIVRIQIDPASAEQTGAAIADALRFALDDYPNAIVAKVFAYGFEDDPASPYTRGVGELSRDGQGWTGNGLLALDSNVSDQQGIAFVVVDLVISDEPVERFRFLDPAGDQATSSSNDGGGNSAAVDALLASGSGGSDASGAGQGVGNGVVRGGWRFRFVEAERGPEFVVTLIGFENLSGDEADAPIADVVLTDGTETFRPAGLIGSDGEPAMGFGAALAIPRFQAGDVLRLQLLYRIPADIDVASLTIAP